MAEVEIVRAQPADLADVERFCDETPEATLYYRPRWQKVLATTYGHVRDDWVARVDGRVAGLLPVDVIRAPLLGTKAVASAYQFEGGVPLAPDDDVRRRLVEAAVERARELGASHLEIRSRGTAPWLEDLGFAALDSQLVVHEVDLSEGVRLKKLRKGHRTDIAFARNRGVTVTPEPDLAAWKRFRRMYLVEGQRMSAPQQGWNYFRNLHAQLPDWCRLFLARSAEGGELGGLLNMDDGRRAFSRHAAYGTEEARRLRAGKILVFHGLQEAAERGCQSMSLGITWVGDPGLIENKEGFRAVRHPVWLYVLPLRGRPPAPGSYFEGYAWAKALWRRTPLPVLEWAGRLVTRWIC